MTLCRFWRCACNFFDSSFRILTQFTTIAGVLFLFESLFSFFISPFNVQNVAGRFCYVRWLRNWVDGALCQSIYTLVCSRFHAIREKRQWRSERIVHFLCFFFFTLKRAIQKFSSKQITRKKMLNAQNGFSQFGCNVMIYECIRTAFSQ